MFARRHFFLLFVIQTGACSEIFRFAPGSINDNGGDAGVDADADGPEIELIELQALALGEYHSCAISNDEVLCWGSNYLEQLGRSDDKGDSFELVVVEGLAANSGDRLVVGRTASNSCLLRTNGEVACWGENGFGQIGGSKDDRGLRTVVELNDTKELALGQDHSCALRSNGDLHCLGSNRRGQAIERLETDCRALTCGALHCCALCGPEGKVFCWGNSFRGAIGGTEEAWQEVPEISGATQLVAGQDHSCALVDNSDEQRVFCWGDNNHLQLGRGEAFQGLLDRTPQKVVDLPPKVSMLCAGKNYTCAKAGTEVLCWGSNLYRQLGRLDLLPSTVVRIDLPPVNNLFCGAEHACVTAADGRLLCWGNNRSGQLRSPASSTDELQTVALTAPVLAFDGADRRACAVDGNNMVRCWGTAIAPQKPMLSIPTPTSPHDSPVHEVAVGEHHACAIDEDSQVICWGSNKQQQLGDDDVANEFVRLPIQAKQVAVGWHHSCALTESGDLSCWGANNHGQLTLPVTSSVTQVVAAKHTTCALAEGNVWCWGPNEQALVPDDQPIQVGGNSIEASQIGLALKHGCAVLVDRRSLVCWGNNLHGQLGRDRNDAGDALAPPQETSVFDDPALEIADLAIGYGVTCVVGQRRSTGSTKVWCWGHNHNRQFGKIARQLKSAEPVEVPDTDGIEEISAGWGFVCGKNTGDDLLCWGDYFWGQLGSGIEVTTWEPAETNLLLRSMTGP